jgi:hypothetical protein
MKKRLLLSVAYWALSLGVMFVFAGFGDGSYAPVAILSSWSALLIKPVVRFFSIGRNNSSSFEIVFSGLFFLYLIALYAVTTILNRIRTGYFAIMPAIIHGLGGLIVLCSLPNASKLPKYGFRTNYFIASYFISLLFAFSFFYADWKLVNRIEKSKKA